MNRRGSVVAVLAVAFALGGLTSCSDSKVKAEPGRPAPTASSAAPSASPTPTVNAEAAPAIAAYEAMVAAVQEAQRHPFKQGESVPIAADFTKYTWDPFRTQYQGYIWGLAERQGEYRGTPPAPHVSVKAVELKAKPWPKVELSDCQTGDDWRLYNAKTGAVQPSVTQKVPPPYPSTATVILYKGTWGVQQVDVDTSQTCSP